MSLKVSLISKIIFIILLILVEVKANELFIKKVDLLPKDFIKILKKTEFISIPLFDKTDKNRKLEIDISLIEDEEKLIIILLWKDKSKSVCKKECVYSDGFSVKIYGEKKDVFFIKKAVEHHFEPEYGIKTFNQEFLPYFGDTLKKIQNNVLKFMKKGYQKTFIKEKGKWKKAQENFESRLYYLRKTKRWLGFVEIKRNSFLKNHSLSMRVEILEGKSKKSFSSFPSPLLIFH